MKLIGVDGCRYGWVAAALDAAGARLFKSAEDLVEGYPADTLFLMDIPIGLDSEGSIKRTCEVDARKLLAPGRKSSVFPVPCREAVRSKDRHEASERNRAILSKDIPVQSWMICRKIREVDTLLCDVPLLRTRIRESHPELAFQSLNGGPVLTRKKTAAGLQERLQILMRHEPAIEAIYRTSIAQLLRKDATRDDILDALCLAVTLKRLVQNGSFGQRHPIDAKGIEMHIHVAPPSAACIGTSP